MRYPAWHAGVPWFLLTALAVVAVGLVPVAAAAVPGDETPQSSLGYPTFRGSDAPVPPPTGVDCAPSPYLQRVFDADVAAGADARPGTTSGSTARSRTGPGTFDGTENLVAFTRGRAVFMKTHSPPGSAGTVTMRRRVARRRRGVHVHRAAGGEYRAGVAAAPDAVVLPVGLHRRRAAADADEVHHRPGRHGRGRRGHRHLGRRARRAALRDVAAGRACARSRATRPSGPCARSTTSRRSPPRLSGDGFTADAASDALVRDLAVAREQLRDDQARLGMLTDERPQTTAEYAAYRAASPAEAFTTHVTAYNRWWALNIPYLDTPSDDIDKTLLYRWWLMRFNYLDADIPGTTTSSRRRWRALMALGYNNAIVLTVGMFVDDLKYFRDPTYAYGPRSRSARRRSAGSSSTTRATRRTGRTRTRSTSPRPRGELRAARRTGRDPARRSGSTRWTTSRACWRRTTATATTSSSTRGAR